MIRKGIIFLIIITNITVCACSNVRDQSKEPQNTVEISESYDDVEAKEAATGVNSVYRDNTLEEKMESELYSENTLIEFPHTDAVEYDLNHNRIIINGISFMIETDGIDYSRGYLAYYVVNDIMEKIMTAINEKDLSKKYWRESFAAELMIKAEESTLLEDFVDHDGKILNYYILDGNFYANSDEAEIPIVVKYSIDGEIYNTVLFMWVGLAPEMDAVLDIWHVDNLDAHMGG